MSKTPVSRGISTTQLRSGDKEGRKRAPAPPKSGAGAASAGSRKNSKDLLSTLGNRRSEKSRAGEATDNLGAEEGIAVPNDAEVGSLACALLTLEQLHELEPLDSAATLAKLAEFLDMPTWKEDLQIIIILTYHFNNYLFAQENKFSTIQMSTFLGMMKYTLDKITEEALPMDKCLIYFKTLLLNHSTAKSPDGNSTNACEIFGPKDAQLITDYAVYTIFQHYRLYQRVFSSEQEISRTELTLNVEVPNKPEPLTEAMKLEDYEFHQKRLQHETEFLKIASLPSSNLLEHPEAIIEQTAYRPLDVLPPEVIAEVVTSAIQESINKLTNEFVGTIEEHRSRILSKIQLVEHTMLSKFGSKMSLTGAMASKFNLSESNHNKSGSKGGLAPS